MDHRTLPLHFLTVDEASLYHSVTLSRCHDATLSPCHPAYFLTRARLEQVYRHVSIECSILDHPTIRPFGLDFHVSHSCMSAIFPAWTGRLGSVIPYHI